MKYKSFEFEEYGVGKRSKRGGKTIERRKWKAQR
jgi:hypothetical protein